MSTNEQRAIHQALQIATLAHKGQFRKFNNTHQPYILHPVRVAGLVLAECPLHPDLTQLMQVAYLHDTLEDSTLTPENLLSEGIPRSVVEMVGWLTRKKTPDGRQANLKNLIRKMDEVPPQYREMVHLVKLADRYDNLDSLASLLKLTRDTSTQEFIVTYATESKSLLTTLISYRGDFDLYGKAWNLVDLILDHQDDQTLQRALNLIDRNRPK